MMSTHHYQQQNHHVYDDVYHSEPRPENSINYKTVVRPPVMSSTSTSTPRPIHFLPTIAPSSPSIMMHQKSPEGSPILFLRTFKFDFFRKLKWKEF